MKNPILFGKHIVLGVSAGISAYKSVELLRQLVKSGANVQVVMTKNATKFVGAITFETLSSNPVFLNSFEKRRGQGIAHVKLAEKADAVILAPATANIIAKIANGIADDALTTFMLAVTCSVIICPSMNSNMYEHPITQRNLECLAQYGYFVLSPNEGDLACGITGPGRLPDPGYIVDRLTSYLSPNDMISKRILITSGPTREFIDPVRFISNPSSGKMGYAMATAAENRGANVTLISGPVSIEAPVNVKLVNVQSAKDMADEVFKNFDNTDIIIKVAAVSDYKPEQFLPYKIKKKHTNINLKCEKTLDILAKIGSLKKKKQIVVGFAAETCDVVLNAQKKLKEKKLDMIVANFIGSPDFGFSSDGNRVFVIFPNGRVEDIPLMSKKKLAHILLDRIYEISKQK